MRIDAVTVRGRQKSRSFRGVFGGAAQVWIYTCSSCEQGGTNQRSHHVSRQLHACWTYKKFNNAEKRHGWWNTRERENVLRHRGLSSQRGKQVPLLTSGQDTALWTSYTSAAHEMFSNKKVYSADQDSALPHTNAFLKGRGSQTTGGIPGVDPILIFLDTFLTTRLACCALPAGGRFLVLLVYFRQWPCEAAAQAAVEPVTRSALNTRPCIALRPLGACH